MKNLFKEIPGGKAKKALYAWVVNRCNARLVISMVMKMKRAGRKMMMIASLIKIMVMMKKMMMMMMIGQY